MPARVTNLEEYRAIRIDAALSEEASLAAGARALDCDYRVALTVHSGNSELAHLHAIAQLCDDLADSADPREAAIHMGQAALTEIARRTNV